jgi:hypothetical protein
LQTGALAFASVRRQNRPVCKGEKQMKKTVILDRSQLLGFRIEPNGQMDSRAGAKVGVKAGAKIGAKIGRKNGPSPGRES